MFDIGIRKCFYNLRTGEISRALYQMVNEFGYVPICENIKSIGGSDRSDGFVHIPFDSEWYESATIVFMTNLNPKSRNSLKPSFYRVLGSINCEFGSTFKYLNEEEIPVREITKFKQRMIKKLEQLSLKLSSDNKKPVIA